MSKVAYALRAEYEDAFAGGVLHVGDGDFDVKQRLDDGGGAIVIDTDEPQATLALAILDEYPALKRIAVTEAERRAAEGDDLSDLTKDQLLDLPEADRVDGAKSLKVDDLRNAIRAAREEE